MFDQLEVLQEVGKRLEELVASGFEPTDGADARALVAETEAVRRRLVAVQVQLLADVERTSAYAADGHVSAKAMVRHVAKLSPAAAAARERGTKLRVDLPDVGSALSAGDLGVDQFDLLGRVHANPRVRDAMADAQEWFLRIAAKLSFRDFEAEVRQWERLVDADGPEPANTKNHDARNVTLLQDHFSLGWKFKGDCGAFQGAAMSEVHQRYVEAERLADWEKARAEHGDDAVAAHLPRTEAQRRADALWQIFQDAAGAQTAVGGDFVHNIVWDAATFEEMIRRLDGQPARPLDPDTYRCETIDGVRLEPVEAAAHALLDKLRRVVVDAAGVVTDLGRARAFTGGARLAAQLSATHCPWPGCAVPASRCQIDHTHDHALGGETNPANGGPFCGRHNRHKQNGFTVWRDPTGEWHVYRRDGTEIE